MTIREFNGADMTAKRFHQELLPAAQPAVFRGLLADWPLVRAGVEGPEALFGYLRRFDRGQPVRAMLAPARVNGRFFYNEDISGFNFRSDPVKIGSALDFLLASVNDERPSAFAVQSVPVWNNLTGLDRENRMPLLPEGVEPRVWIGNAVTVAAHFDPSENLACVVSGRRRFTLFPPDQVANLYPGPFELNPAGPIISMVDFDAPDLERHPGFAAAMHAATVVDLQPGDVLYIPYLWWHHVRSVERVNMLVNYWWTPPTLPHCHPVEAMMHAMLALNTAPEPHRAAWRSIFDHYVFGVDGPPGTHLPPERRGIQGEVSEDMARGLRRNLAQTLSR